MKKLLLFHHFNAPWGAGLSLLHILQSIDKKEYDVTVCIPDIGGTLDDKIKDMGINVMYSNSVVSYMQFNGYDMSFLSKEHYNNVKLIRLAKKGLAKIIDEVNPDIIAVNSVTLFWIGKIAKSMNKPVICFNRETYRKGLLGVRDRYVKKCLSNDFDLVVFLSNFDMNETPNGNAKYIRITDKVDFSLYEKLNKQECRNLEQLNPDDKLLLYVGGMAKLKGAMVLAKAINCVKDEDIKVVFLQYTPLNKYDIDTQSYQYQVEKYISDHHLTDRFIFRPATDKVERYFVASDALVFPCINAHQARPIYEAGAANIPLIISNFKNYEEFVTNDNGWLFKPNNYLELAKCIDEVFSKDTSSKIDLNRANSLKNNNLGTLSNEINKLLKSL